MADSHRHPWADEIASDIKRGFTRALVMFAVIVLGSQLLVLLALN